MYCIVCNRTLPGLEDAYVFTGYNTPRHAKVVGIPGRNTGYMLLLFRRRCTSEEMDKSFNFNVFVNIQSDLKEDDVEKLKFLLVREVGIRETLKCFIELVEHLSHREPDNYLNLLQTTLEEICRVDLANRLSKHLGRCEQESSYTMEQDFLCVVSSKRIPTKNYNGERTDVYDEFLMKTSNFKGIRGYQQELAQPALDGCNSIICAPTGSGKTVTAGYICKRLIEKNPSMKIVFLVPVRSLGKQQSKLLSEMLNLTVLSNPEADVNLLLEMYNIVVLTPQVLINELERGTVGLEELDLIVFDECHHTKLDQPYNRLMKIYHLKRMSDADCKLPKILGLTASLGTDNSSNEEQIIEHFANLCARLDSTIKTVRDPRNRSELLKFNSKPRKDQIITCQHRRDNRFSMAIISLMSTIEKDNDIPQLHTRGSQGYQNKLLEQQKLYEEKEGTLEKILACMTLNVLNEALMLYNDATEEYVIEFVTSVLRTLDKHEIRKKYRNMVIECLEGLIGTFNLKDSWKNNQKLVELCKLLEETIEQNATCILIAKTCRIVDFLYDFLTNLQNLNDELYILKVVGQQNSEYGMSEQEQIKTISNFKGQAGQKGALLIGTNVIQEGFDLPKCNLVIRYNHVSNEIGTIQARGRARAPDSKIYLIVDEDSVDIKREYENLLKERKMLEVMDSLSEKQKYFQDLVDKAKAKLERDLNTDIEKRDTLMKYSADDVDIHCKLCKTKICSGSDIKKSPAGYVILEPLLEDMSYFEKWTKEKSFPLEYQLGEMKCRLCEVKLAVKILFKKFEVCAYILARNNLSWKTKEKTTYNLMPKKWNMLEFPIKDLKDKQLELVIQCK